MKTKIIVLTLIFFTGSVFAQTALTDSLDIISDTLSFPSPEPAVLTETNISDTLTVLDEPTDSLAHVIPEVDTTSAMVNDITDSVTTLPSLIDALEDIITAEVSIEPGSDFRLLVLYKSKTNELYEVERIALSQILYSELHSVSDMGVISHEEANAAYSDCLTDSCISEMGKKLKASHVLLWTLNQKREIIKLGMTLSKTNGKQLGKVASYYQGELSEMNNRIREDCLKLFGKQDSLDLFDKGKLKEMGLMVEYYIGKDKALMGAGALSAAGLLAILLHEEDKGPGIGLPPEWPGE